MSATIKRYAIVRQPEGHTLTVEEALWDGNEDTLDGWLETQGLDAEEVNA